MLDQKDWVKPTVKNILWARDFFYTNKTERIGLLMKRNLKSKLRRSKNCKAPIRQVPHLTREVAEREIQNGVKTTQKKNNKYFI